MQYYQTGSLHLQSPRPNTLCPQTWVCKECTGSTLDVVSLDLFVFLFMPETKGRTLEEIEAMFDQVKHGTYTIRIKTYHSVS